MTVRRCSTASLSKLAADRGFSLPEVSGCIVSYEPNGMLLVDVNHISYPAGKTNGACNAGTALTALLSRIGIAYTPDCPCRSHANQMDAWGCDECERRIDEIVGWLREEATKRGLPFLDVAGRMLVRRAIRNARRAAQS